MSTLILLTAVAVVSIFSWGAPLRVSLPPAMGAVPIVMAETWELFKDEGIEITLIPLPSQSDREFAFRAGQVDVMLTDLTGALLLLQSLPQGAVIVGTGYAPDPEGNHLAFLTPPTFSRIRSWDDLVARVRGGTRVQIALPRESDLEFAADEAFRSAGLSVPADLYIGQDNLLDNATWVLFGLVAVAVLPQPYVDYILTYSYPGKPTLEVIQWVAGASLPPEVIVARRSIVESRLDDLAAFFRAVRHAVDRLNSEDRDDIVASALPVAVDLFFPGGGPEQATDPLVRAEIEKGIAAIVIPHFPQPGVLDPEVYGRVMTWAVGKRYLRSPIEYDAVVVSPPG